MNVVDGDNKWNGISDSLIICTWSFFCKLHDFFASIALATMTMMVEDGKGASNDRIYVVCAITTTDAQCAYEGKKKR